MTKDVIISISGLQYSEEDASPVPVEILSPADYYEKNNTHYIMYDEVSEDYSGTTRNMIKLKPDYVEISKKGQNSVNMRFETGKKYHTYYQTPYGSLLVAIMANKINLAESTDEITLNMDYELEINSEPLSNCQINIKIKPKEQTQLTC